jgi:hypothetical protein
VCKRFAKGWGAGLGRHLLDGRKDEAVAGVDGGEVGTGGHHQGVGVVGDEIVLGFIEAENEMVESDGFSIESAVGVGLVGEP